MVADKRWKLIHFEGGFRPMLFDLQTDPEEFVDLGASPDHAEVRATMYERLGEWGRRQSQRVTRSAADIARMRGASERRGVVLGVYDEDDVEAELIAKYTGRARADFTGGE